MRIALVTNAFPRHDEDYYGIFIWELASFLQERGHVVHVVTSRRLGTERECTFRGIRVHRYEYRGWTRDRRPGELEGHPLTLASLVFEGARCLVGVVRNERVDLIHAYWLLPSGLIALLAGLATRHPVVSTGVGTDLNALPRKAVPRMLLRLVLTHSRLVTVLGSAMREKALQLGARIGRVRVVLGDAGVDGALFTPASSPPPSTALFVGGLTPPKRLDTVLHAMAIVTRQFPNARLRIVGDGVDRQRWETLAGELGLNRVVQFAGAVPHERVPGEMQQASVLVLCSDHEGSPVVIREALMCGLPVVATRVGGIPDLIVDGDNGYLVSPESPEEVADRLMAVFANPAHARRLGEAGLAFAGRALGRDVIVTQLEEAYSFAIQS